MPIRPPGLRTREISVSTAGLSGDRLITQLEMTTSTESAGSGIAAWIGATAPAAAGHALAGRADGYSGLGVAAANLLADLVGGRSHQQHAPFRSATAASCSIASRRSEKYAHLPRCSRSSRPA